MRLEDKIGQMLMVGFHGLEAPDYLLDWLRDGRVGGVILFARNVDSPEQLARLTDSLHKAARGGVLIGIDQEGGTVARLRQGFTESPGAMALSAAANGPQLAEQVSRVLAVELAALGLNWNFAPSLDLAYTTANPALGTRSFGSEAARVAEMGAAAIHGFQGAGVAACAKHFPGLGNTNVDTHLALPMLDTPVDQLLQQDLLPYRTAIRAGVASVMTTHTIFSTLDAELPATLSPVIVRQLLRQELGFDGVVSSDCMEMKAIADHHSPGETAVLAAQAGLDMILFSHTRAAQEDAYQGLLAAARDGRLPLESIDAANRRIAAMKTAFIASDPDLSRIRQPAHLQLVLEAARAGTVLLRDDGLLPLGPGASLVEFASHLESGILESSGGMIGLGACLREYFPDMPMIALPSTAPPASRLEQVEHLVRTAETVVLATRNALLNPDQLEAARWITTIARQVILVCLRVPYDGVALPDARTVICTCGDSQPSLQAAADALAGKFTPSGQLPVPLRTA